MLTNTIAQDIDRLLESGKEFGIACFPGEDTPNYFARDVASASGPRTSSVFIHDANSARVTMEIVPWLGKFADRITIGAPRKRTHYFKIHTPYPKSTTREEYLAGVKGVIKNCSRRNGKTVYSRIITGGKPRRSFGEIAYELFIAHPSTLRFIYKTPETGCWMGATPELLFAIDTTAHEVHTMAFAGTRKAGISDKWDEKNSVENRFVVDYILEKLRMLGMKPQVGQPETIRYGNIEHLCHRISAKCLTIDTGCIADALNPTPALCGWPLNEAVNDIQQFERHERHCYGGYIGFSSETGYTAYVNLRCMSFTPDGFCIYGGGGITGNSIAEEEFAETQSKTELLQQLTGALNYNIANKTL